MRKEQKSIRIGGEVFTPFSIHTSKRTAKAAATRRRNRGYKARLKKRGSGLWVVLQGKRRKKQPNPYRRR